MKNIDVRVLVTESGLTYKEIAKELNISQEWMSRLMRYTLSPENRERILSAVMRLREAKNNG